MRPADPSGDGPAVLQLDTRPSDGRPRGVTPGLPPAEPQGADVAVPDTDDARRAGTKLVVVGQGYVGLPIAVRAASLGFRVVGFDLDARRVADLRGGHSGIHDVGAPELYRVLTSRRYVPTDDPAACAGFDAAVITVPTPLQDGAPDLTAVAHATRTLAGMLQPGSLVVLESSSYPGTTEEVVRPLLEAGSGLTAGRDFSLGCSPERIDPGNLAYPFWRIPKLVSGIDERSLDRVDALYSQLVESTVRVTNVQAAETAKLLENTFRYVNIALVNELSTYAWSLGIDMGEVLDAAATKPFGFMRFEPGPGVGGHCLPVDPLYLSWKVARALGRRFRFVELADDVNTHMPDYVVERITRLLNRRGRPVQGARLLLLGLTYKPNTADDRESPARRVVHLLRSAGADVRAFDRHVAPERVDPAVRLVDLTSAELRESDLVVLLTDHDDVAYDVVTSEAPAVLDTRRRLHGPRVEQL